MIAEPAADPRSASEAVGRGLCELAAHIHAGTARLARLAAAFDDAGGWHGEAMRSCAQWLSINAGFDAFTAEELVRVGHALAALPRVAGAFAAGELSLDKVRAVSRVAATHDEAIWLDIAREASGAQLARICREYRRATRTESPERAEAHQARRGLWTWWDDDGMLHVRATLPPEDGALVQAALDAAGLRAAPEPITATEDASMRDRADDPAAARRADALVSLCDDSLAGGEEIAGTPAPARMVVHVDVGVLTGETQDGRCHLQGGPALSSAVARRLGCDAQVVAVTERDGLPIDVGRARRVVPTALRRALQERDRTCRFPGCSVPAEQTHAHHIREWATGGRTDLSNLLSLCGFHHRRLHDAVYRVRSRPGGGLRFETADGRPIRLGPLRVDVGAPASEALCERLAPGARPDAQAPRAGSGGAPFSMPYVVEVVANACESARARAGPSV